MFYRQASDQYINEGVAFKIDGTQYPANWLNCTTPEEKAALGLVEVTNANSPEDDRFYWVSSTLNGAVRTYTNTPKDLDQLKTQWVASTRQSAYNILVTTDYMDSRKVNDPTYTAPPAWVSWRESIRTTVKTAVTAINASTDIPTLQIAIIVNWPHDPNYKEPVIVLPI